MQPLKFIVDDGVSSGVDRISDGRPIHIDVVCICITVLCWSIHSHWGVVCENLDRVREYAYTNTILSSYFNAILSVNEETSGDIDDIEH